MMFLAVIALARFTGPDDQQIEINPESVVSLRAPRSEEHFAAGVHCLIHTLDSKFIAVIESCAVVQQRLEETEQ